MHPDPQRGEGAGVLAPDDARAHDRQRLREGLEVQDLVRVADPGILEPEEVGTKRRGAGRDQHPVGAQQDFPRGALRADRVRIHEGGLALDQPDAHPRQVLVDPPPLDRRHVLLVMHEVRDGRLPPQREIDAVELSRPVAAQGERGLAKRLAGERPRVGDGAPEEGVLLDDRDLLAEEGGRDRTLLPRGAGADHDEIERFGRHVGRSVPRCFRDESGSPLLQLQSAAWLVQRSRSRRSGAEGVTRRSILPFGADCRPPARPP
jgi:hypothetical protein